MRTQNLARLKRLALIQVVILSLAFPPGALAQMATADVEFQRGRMLIQSPYDTIEVDRDAATLWINRHAISMDPEFLNEIDTVLRAVTRAPSEEGIRHAAALFSRETVSRLQLIRDALNRPGDLIAVNGMDQCGPSGIGWGLTVAGYGVACTAAVVGTGGGAAPCFIAIAAWTASTWNVANCMGRQLSHRNGNGNGNGGDNDHDDGPRDSDQDGVPDTVDGCPMDPGKHQPGLCGCGVSDVDSDFDGTPDCMEECPIDDCDGDEEDDEECTLIQLMTGECSIGLP